MSLILRAEEDGELRTATRVDVAHWLGEDTDRRNQLRKLLIDRELDTWPQVPVGWTRSAQKAYHDPVTYTGRWLYSVKYYCDGWGIWSHRLEAPWYAEQYADPKGLWHDPKRHGPFDSFEDVVAFVEGRGSLPPWPGPIEGVTDWTVLQSLAMAWKDVAMRFYELLQPLRDDPRVRERWYAFQRSVVEPLKGPPIVRSFKIDGEEQLTGPVVLFMARDLVGDVWTEIRRSPTARRIEILVSDDEPLDPS